MDRIELVVVSSDARARNAVGSLGGDDKPCDPPVSRLDPR